MGGIEVDIDGKRVRVSPMGPGVRDNFARWFKGWAFRQLEESRDIVNPARFARMEAAIAVAISLGKYNWGGECHMEVMDSKIGVGGEMLARINVLHPEVTEEQVWQLGDKIGWDGIVQRLNSADGINPKDQTPDGAGEPPPKESTTMPS